jgi:hypothetical protein
MLHAVSRVMPPKGSGLRKEKESMGKKASAEKAVREIRRKTRRRFSAEEKIRIVIEGLRGEESIRLDQPRGQAHHHRPKRRMSRTRRTGLRPLQAQGVAA